MDIPYYYEVYKQPHHHCGPHHHCHHDSLSYVRDMSKTIDILDPFGVVQYVVQLSSMALPDAIGYKTIVTKVYDPEHTSAFLEIPDADQWQTDYLSAMHDFHVCVERYSSLVKAENKDFRDIDIYKERIDYVETRPECCQFCRWSISCFEDSCSKPNSTCKSTTLVCTNPENQKQFKYLDDLDELDPHCHHHRKPSAWNHLPWQEKEPIPPPPNHMMPIYPRVDPFGKCINFTPENPKHQ